MAISESCYYCLQCRKTALVEDIGKLKCDSCKSFYKIDHSIPLLFPSEDYLKNVHGRSKSAMTLSILRQLYDKVYSHDGLMGTDLDKTFDSKTKTRLISFSRCFSSKRLLDIGTGIGNLWEYIHESVEGYTIDVSVMRLLKAKTNHQRLNVCAAIAECLPYNDNFFDAVIAADTIEHTFSPELALAEIFLVLVPGGLFALSLPTPKSLRKWGWNQLI